jgi:hypothetical protein
VINDLKERVRVLWKDFEKKKKQLWAGPGMGV